MIKRLFPLFFYVTLMACAPAMRPPHPEPRGPNLARAHYVTQDGAVLPVRSWWPPARDLKALVVGLHGFNDYGRAFAQPGEYLSQRGIAVIAYDQRGFGNAPGRGLWAGTDAYANDLERLIRQVHLQYPGVPVFVLGESMGGAVAIAALTSPSPPEIAGLILSAPAVWSRDMMPWYQRAVLALAASTLPDLELTGRGLKIQASDNIEMLRGLGRDPLVIKSTRVDAIEGLTDLMDIAQARAGLIKVPVLVLYGARDQVIPKRPVESMLRQLSLRPDTTNALYPQGYHLLLRDLHADVPLRDVVAWINDRYMPLPSGFGKPPGS
ncbi:MAG: alpha/beta hydrolase [Methylococcaceae bacterium]|nr:alpha/beta hydrolase [Methylococcaceae bacterium]